MRRARRANQNGHNLLFLELPIKRYEIGNFKRSADIIADVTTPEVNARHARGGVRRTARSLARGAQRQALPRGRCEARAGAPPDRPQGGMWKPATGARFGSRFWP